MRSWILILTFIVSFSKLQGQSFSWAHGAGTWVTDRPFKIISDSHDNSYITGHVHIGASFGAYKAEDWGFFLAKYDPLGNVLWARFGEGSYNGTGRALAVDSEGSIYVGGQYSHRLDFGDTLLVGAHQTTVFLAKYSSTGDLVWAKNVGVAGENGWPSCGGVALDDEDNVYVAGIFSGILRLENEISIRDANPTYWGYYNVFLARYDKQGQIDWGMGGGTAYHDSNAVDLVSGPNNSIYLAAQVGYNSPLKFGSETIETGLEENGSVILGLSPSGEITWTSAMNGEISDLEVSNDDRLLACGIFRDSISFDGTSPLYSDHNGGFIVKYEPDRTISWSKLVDYVPGYLPPYPYVAEHEGNIYLGGTYDRPFTIDDAEINSGQQGDAFILKISDFGYYQWIKMIERGEYWERNRIKSLTVTPNGTITIAGEYTAESLNFDGIAISNNSGNGDEDIFVAAIADQTTVTCPLTNPVLGSDTVICEGSSAILSPIYATSTIPAAWYHNDLPVGRSASAFTAQQAGDYYYVLYPNTVCADTSNIVTVDVIEKPVADIQVSPGLTRCDGGSVLLETVEKDHLSYRWLFNKETTDETENLISVSKSGSYSVIVNNGVCSTTSTPSEVTIVEPVENFLPDTAWICANESIELSPTIQTGNWSHYWSTQERSPTIMVADSGSYVLTITRGGCTYVDQTIVRQYPSLWIPNVVTPNGDGKNDYLILGNNQNGDVELVIMDRWGDVVYESSSYQNDWFPDDISTGAYFYAIKDNCSRTESKGWLHVLY